jgi:flagellar basal body-associated protein FliL
MADEERFLDEDVTGEEEQPVAARPGILPAVLLVVLKWAAIGLAAVILIATVSWATFSLFIRGKTPSGLGEFSPEYKESNVQLEFFTNMINNIRGQTSDDPPKSFLASVSIGYKKGNMKIQTELVDKTEQIQNTVLKFFGKKTSQELTTANFDNLEKELKGLINNGIMRNGQITQVLIHELQTF